MSTDNNFTIRDNTSEFAKYLSGKWIEPFTIITRVKGYNGIDEYILELIQDKIEQFTDTRDNLDDAFQEYMHNMIKGKDVPNEWASNPKEEQSNKEENASKFVKQVQNEYHELKEQQQENDNNNEMRDLRLFY